MISQHDRYAADVFGLTYREFAEVKPRLYKWRVLAMEAVTHLRHAVNELWSHEKLAEYLHSNAEDAAIRLRRFKMSEKVNAGKNGSERILSLFMEWLIPLEKDDRERKILAKDLSRLLASQLQLAMASGEKLEDLANGLEGEDAPQLGPADPGKKPWGPQWKE